MNNFTKQIKNLAEVIKADKARGTALFVQYRDDIRRFFITDGKEIYADAKVSNTLEDVEPWKANNHQILKTDLVNVAKNLKEGCELEIKEGNGGLQFNVTKKNGSKTSTFVTSSTKEPFPDFFDSPHCYAQIRILPEDKAKLATAIKNMNALINPDYSAYTAYLHIFCNEPSEILLKQIYGRHCSDFRMPVDTWNSNMQGTNASVHIHKDHLSAVAKVLECTSKDKYFQLAWVPLPIDANEKRYSVYNVIEAMSWFEDNVLILRFVDQAKDTIKVPSTAEIGANQNCAGRLEIKKDTLIEIIKQGLEGRKDLDLVVRYNSNEFEFVSGDYKCSIFQDGVKTELYRGENWAAQMPAATLLKLLKVSQGENIAINFLLASNSDTELMTAQICEGAEGKEANHGYAFFIVRSHEE